MAFRADTAQQRFALVLRGEHRVIRDLLLLLADAFELRDTEGIRSIFGEFASFAGPHFRYEEEALYPGFAPILGPEYANRLRVAHEVAIASAQRLEELSRLQELTEEDVDEAVWLVHTILPHVSDFEGPGVIVELLTDETVGSVLQTRETARRAGFDLLTWSAEVRTP
jgi:hypothetical protein